MAMQRLKTVDVKGKKFNVSIDGDGNFFAECDAEQVRAESLKGLISTLQKRMARQKRVSIPFAKSGTR